MSCVRLLGQVLPCEVFLIWLVLAPWFLVDWRGDWTNLRVMGLALRVPGDLSELFFLKIKECAPVRAHGPNEFSQVSVACDDTLADLG